MTITSAELIDDEDMTEKFHVVYDGSALDEHLMDVRDLAPAMMAISDLLIHANQEINGDKLKIELKVKANFKAGSFGIEFHEILTWYHQIRDILTGPNATALANAGGLLALIGMFKGSKSGLIQLYQNLKGKPPVKVEEDVDGVKVYYSETEFELVDKRVLRLYRNKAIASDINKMLEPLSKDGIDSFYVVRDEDKDQVELLIDKADVDFFQYQEIEDDLNFEISETYIQIESVSFKEKNKWKFSNGKFFFNAKITDEDFLAKIDSGELRFGKGDILKVKLKTVQTIAHNKLKSDYEVIKVIEHKIIKKEQENLGI